MERIGVFCASSAHVEQRYKDAARELGHWMGQQGKVLVYGGCRSGLMEEVAQAVKQSGGRVFGVLPSFLVQSGRVSDCVDVQFLCDTLSERKDFLLQESDIMVALPGGVGTLDEIFSVMASSTVGEHHKKVVLYNEGGFWNELLQMLDAMDRCRLINHPLEQVLLVANDMDSLKTILQRE